MALPISTRYIFWWEDTSFSYPFNPPFRDTTLQWAGMDLEWAGEVLTWGM